MSNSLKTKPIDSFQNLSFFESWHSEEFSNIYHNIYFSHRFSFLGESFPTWAVQKILQAKQYLYEADLLNQFDK